MNSIIAKCSACGAKNRIHQFKQHLGPICARCGEKLELRQIVTVVNLDDKTMDGFIKSVKLPLLVDFYSPTCGPCATLAPILDDLAKSYLGRLIVAKVDTSRNPGCSAYYRIKGVPTLIFFKNGKKVEEVVGLPDKNNLLAKLDYYSG